MSISPRPSGATIQVLKTFATEDECAEQARLMLAAPFSVSMKPTILGPRQYTLPLVTSRVPSSAFMDLLHVYTRLWATPSPRAPVSREDYHAYVTSRAAPAHGVGDVRWLWSEALRAAHGLYERIESAPIGAAAFTHGDAIIGNAVMTTAGVRLIDFSPRPTPGEPEIDVAKLQFSSLGFDLDKSRRREFTAVLAAWARGLGASRALIDYYLATHLVRVLSKEPPETINRREFYERTVNYVCAQL